VLIVVSGVIHSGTKTEDPARVKIEKNTLHGSRFEFPFSRIAVPMNIRDIYTTEEPGRKPLGVTYRITAYYNEKTNQCTNLSHCADNQ
jgi:hypothetical protein